MIDRVNAETKELKGSSSNERGSIFWGKDHLGESLLLLQSYVSVAYWILHNPVVGQFEPANTVLLYTYLGHNIYWQRAVGAPCVYQGFYLDELCSG